MFKLLFKFSSLLNAVAAKTKHSMNKQLLEQTTTMFKDILGLIEHNSKHHNSKQILSNTQIEVNNTALSLSCLITGKRKLVRAVPTRESCSRFLNICYPICQKSSKTFHLKWQHSHQIHFFANRCSMWLMLDGCRSWHQQINLSVTRAY